MEGRTARREPRSGRPSGSAADRTGGNAAEPRPAGATRAASAALVSSVAALSALLPPPSASAQEPGDAGSPPLDPTRAMPEGYAGESPGNAAWDDPDHPLKQNRDPGSAWDASNMSEWHDDHRETPGIRNAVGDWEWGELYFDRTYPGTLVVKNECTSPQVVNVFVEDLPYLRDVPDQVKVPGSSEKDVDIEIVTPPEPDPPVNPRPFDPTAPGFGWVEPPDLPPRPNPFDPTAPEWHQPNFVPVDGRVVLWHPWTRECVPRRVTYRASGHIHWEPPGEEPDRGPERIAKPDPCAVYWNTGEPPPDLEGKDCTEVFRGFAVAFLETILQPRAEEEPGRWEWLPSAAELQSMAAGELLAFRERAEGLLRDGPGARGEAPGTPAAASRAPGRPSAVPADLRDGGPAARPHAPAVGREVPR